MNDDLGGGKPDGREAWPLVAVIDSGLAPSHPHVAGLCSTGFALYSEGGSFRQDPDHSDCTGHGTAVTAALHRVVPEAPVLAIRVLDEDLRCTSAVLVEAIRRAADAGAKIVNLSLGSGDPEATPLLQAAVDEVTALGAVCVAAAHPRGRPLWPADLSNVLSAQAHRSCPLDDLFRVPGPVPRYLTHGFPRPIDGQPPTQNLFGPSFAAIHLSARVARLLQADPGLDFVTLRELLDAECSGEWAGVP